MDPMDGVFFEDWTIEPVRQRWAYSSSYVSTVSAWQGDGLDGSPVFVPRADTPHRLAFTGPDEPEVADGRRYTEVRFPSAKVHMFEEFDRRQAGSPYFAYDHATPAKLMFDGSVNQAASGHGMPAWNPALGKAAWSQAYVPIHEFPVPLGGLGDDTPLDQRYRWTLGGLQGIDYGAPLMRR